MAKRGENIYHRRDGRYEGRYIKGRRENGKPIFGSIYGKHYVEVKDKLVLLKATYADMKRSVFSACPSFLQWAMHWMELYCRPYVKITTYDLYQRILSLHLYPRLGKLPLDEITEDVLKELIAGLQETLSASTIAGVYRLLKTVLREANQRGALAKLPPNVRLAKAPQRDPRLLTHMEQKRMEKEIARTGESCLLLALYTGLRVGELCGLRWYNIDLENAKIMVRHSVKRQREKDGRTHTVLSDTKTECSVRDIPIPAFIVKMLQKLRINNAITQDDNFLFPGMDGGCLDTRSMQLRFARMTRRLGLYGVHMHTLRHTYATRCLEKNVGVETLCLLLGHSSPNITLRCYAHATPEQKRRCVGRLRPIGTEVSVT